MARVYLGDPLLVKVHEEGEGEREKRPLFAIDRGPLWEDNGLLRIPKSLQRCFQSIDHRRRAAEEDTGGGIGSRKVLSKNFGCNSSCAARPFRWWLFQDVVAMKVGMFLNVSFPLVSEDDVRFCFIGNDQK